MRKNKLIGAFVAVSIILGGFPAMAGTTAAVLEEITVTAQKQEENIQDVPVSMTVLDAVAIEDATIESVLDLGDVVPNLYIFESGVTGLNVPVTRGLYAQTETTAATTGIYLDGVPVATGTEFDVSFSDIERIEVLRGPQGTLYGKGAEGGVINIITRQPDNTLVGQISVQAGRWLSSEADDWLGRTSLYMGGPVVKDKLFFGISGNYQYKDGFIYDAFTDQAQNRRTKWSGKFNLRWKATDKLDISAFISRLEYDDDGGSLDLSALGEAAFGVPSTPYRVVSCDLTNEFLETTLDMQALKIIYDVTDALSLTSVTTHIDSKHDGKQDFDFSEYPVFHSTSDIFTKRTSQELRLGYAGNGVKWLAGLYFETEERGDKRITDSMVPTFAGTTQGVTEDTTYAAFAHLTWPLTDRLSLVAGVRYETDDRDYEDKINGGKKSDSWDILTPKFAVEYDVTPHVMGYASATMGYRSGGFNILATSPEFSSFEPEKLWSYEMGAKAALLEGTLIVNGAVFYMNIQDYQTIETQWDGMAFMINAPGATSKGLEMDLTYKPARSITLNAGFGYTDVEIDSFSDAKGDYTGNQGPWSPEYTFHLGGQYRHPDTGWYARVDLIGYGKTYYDKDNTYFRDPYEIVNVKFGYEWEKFDVYLYGKNIFDTEYDAVNSWGGISTMYSEPGVIGLQMTYRF